MRAVRLCLAGVIVVSVLVLVGGSARAGGSWLEWDRFAYSPGESAAGTTQFGPGCCGRGEPADGPYYLDLRRNDGTYEMPPLPDDVIPLNAALEISDGGSPWTASASFTVPDVEAGEYQVIHCNDPCTKLLGDLLIANLHVVADDGEDLLARRVDRLRTRLTAGLYRAKNRFVTKARLEVATDALDRRLDALEDEIGSLQSKLAGTAEKKDDGAGLIQGSLGLGGLVTGMALAWAAIRRRRVA